MKVKNHAPNHDSTVSTKDTPISQPKYTAMLRTDHSERLNECTKLSRRILLQWSIVHILRLSTGLMKVPKVFVQEPHQSYFWSFPILQGFSFFPNV